MDKNFCGEESFEYSQSANFINNKDTLQSVMHLKAMLGEIEKNNWANNNPNMQQFPNG